MHTFLLVALLIGAQAPDDQPWTLDAPGVFSFTRTVDTEAGEPQLTTTVRALPNPFRVSTARVLRSDGAPVTVLEGLQDIGATERLDEITSSVRGEWWRLSMVQAVIAGAGFLVGMVGALPFLGGVALAASLNPGFRGIPQEGIQPQDWPAILGIGALVLGGVAVMVPGAIILVVASNRSLWALRHALQTSWRTVGGSWDWPVGAAAEVVEEHNRRVLPESGGPAREPPPPDENAIIPS